MVSDCWRGQGNFFWISTSLSDGFVPGERAEICRRGERQAQEAAQASERVRRLRPEVQLDASQGKEQTLGPVGGLTSGFVRTASK